MKKNLQMTALAIALAIGIASAQTGKVVSTQTGVKVITPQTQNSNQSGNYTPVINQPTSRNCGSQVPSAEWDAWFNKAVEEFKAANPEGKNMANYTIPVIFHIIHTGQAAGTYPNLNIGQINSQLTVLNQDFASAGLNVGNLPAVFASAKANTNVQFCMATKSPTGATLAEPGVERIACSSKGWANPTSFTSITTFQNFIDGTVKPQSIWDPTRYFNVWVTDCAGSVGLLGYATFPIGTGLVGITGTGTGTTDGVWNYAASLGSNSIFPGGTYAAPYNKGRTLVHEAGHWLGLRHINGDASCATDYCADTPTQSALNGGCPAFPKISCSNGPNGEMHMNFMDYTDDACMYMFTNDQRTRIQTAMANGTYRNMLTTSAATLCTLTATAPTANFSTASTACVGSAITTTNNSTGIPTPTYSWSAAPTSVTFTPNSTTSNPSITFGNTGTYVITLVATNSLGTNSYTQAVTVSSCAAVCTTSITNVQTTATLNLATAGSDTTTPGCSPKAGYIFGSNCYQDREKAEFFAQSMYASIATPKVKSVVVLFFKNGTQGTGGTASVPVNLKLYNGTMAGGPSATTTPIATATANLGMILGTTPTTSVTNCGAPVVFSSAIIIPYKYNFPTYPTAPATNGFFASVMTPTTSGDTVVVMSDNTLATGTNWELWNPSGWYNVSPTWGGFDAAMAMIPEITCSITTGFSESVLAQNVTLMPNPTTGQFHIATTLPNSTDLTLTVTNALSPVITKS